MSTSWLRESAFIREPLSSSCLSYLPKATCALLITTQLILVRFSLSLPMNYTNFTRFYLCFLLLTVMDIIDTDDNSIDVMSEAIANGKICHFNLDHVTKQIQQCNSNEADSEGALKCAGRLDKAETIYQWAANEKMSGDLKSTDCCDSQDYPRSSWDQFSILVRRMIKQRCRNTVRISR